MREPSFYPGLFGPLLYLALQGGIAYTWGLQHNGLGPAKQMILTPETFASPDVSLPIADAFASNRSNLETCYFFFSFFASYSSPVRNIESVIDAI